MLRVASLRRWIVVGAVGVSAALASFGGSSGTADAAEQAGAAITWAVNPVPGVNGQPRSWVDLTLDPGESASDAMQVRNFSSVPVTFTISSADGYFNERGRFNMLPADRTSVDAGTWISVDKTVTVGVNESVDIPFTVTVPKDALPGDHAAGLAASISSAGTDAGGSSVGVESRIGFRVLTRVTGELAPSYVVSDVSSDYETNWNPLRPGELAVSFTLRNTGNIRLVLAADATTALGPGGEYAPAAGERPMEFLPGDERRVTVAVPRVWPVFAVPGELTVAPIVVNPQGASLTVEPTTQSFVGVAVPWPQVLSLLGVALIVGALVWDKVRSRRRLRRAVELAREEERRAAATVASGDESGANVTKTGE